MPSERDFTWRDGERTVVFREGVFADAPDLLGQGIWGRFELLTTPRALGSASVELGERSGAVHQVPGGPVPEAAAALIELVRNPTLVALGGGRVIDVAKAIAAVRGGRVCAMPTTLSGAEMTTIHRLPAGRETQAPHLVRPVLVIADPVEMTSLDDRRLRASAMNALAHGAEALYGPLANPVATLSALRGAELIASALDRDPDERDRPALALGSILSANALDSAGFGLHHVVCQTLVRILEIPHAETNATMLPRTMAAMRSRAPDEIESLATARGTTTGRIQSRLQSLSGGRRRLRDLDPDPERLEAAVNAILSRPDLATTPDPPDREELQALLKRAW
jgi:alcohol dehydrogenase class IV